MNQLIEAYCYCILGAQARTRSTIHGISGGAIETQSRVPRSHRRLYRT